MTKILLLSANPNDTISLELYREIHEISNEVRHAKFSNMFEFEPKVAVKWRDISELLSRYKPDIVHFSGHGNESAELIFEDERGISRPVSIKDIRTLFRALKDNIKCVVLNACYAEAQATEIADYIDCVIGISGEIDDTAAIGFSREFYRQLADGKDILTAYQLGCMHVAQGQELVKLISPRANSTQIIFVQSEKHNYSIISRFRGWSVQAIIILLIIGSVGAIGYLYKEGFSTGIDHIAIDSLPYTALAWEHALVPEEKGSPYTSFININLNHLL